MASIQSSPEASSWQESLRSFLHPAVITMLFLGFSAGIPILLIFSSLSLWLGEAGVERKMVTYFSWAALGYSFKFVWAPLVDRLPIPFLTKWLGRRRGWILLSQLLVIIAIVCMALTDPAQQEEALTLMALSAVFLGFSSATQDIVIDAYRIESAETRLQALMSSTYITGYRIGMIVAGAGALFLAAYFGTTKASYSYEAWQYTYLCMAAVMLIGVVTTLVIVEPDSSQAALKADEDKYNTLDYLRLVLVFVGAVFVLVMSYSWLSGFIRGYINEQTWAMQAIDTLGKPLWGFLTGSIRMLTSLSIAVLAAWGLASLGVAKREMVYESWISPIVDFFQRYGLLTAALLLALVGFYRISDIVLGAISNVFYQDMGYTKVQIALAVKTMGVILSILGGFLGGLLSVHLGVMRMLMAGAILASLTNLLFVLLAQSEPSEFMLYLVVGADNFVAGLASAAFIAFLSNLTNVSFTAMQYAIFSSLMTLFPKLLGGYSGAIVDGIGYSQFFLMTAVIGIPVFFLVWLASRKLNAA